MPPTDAWGQWGVVGLLIGVVVLAAWTLLNSVLKSRDSDLLWYRTEYTNKRQEYLASIQRMQQEYSERLKQIAEDFHHSVEAICERLEHLEQRMESVLRDVSAARKQP